MNITLDLLASSQGVLGCPVWKLGSVGYFTPINTPFQTSWWLNHPVEKYESKWESSPSRDEHLKKDETTTQLLTFGAGNVQMMCHICARLNKPTSGFGLRF